MWKIPGQSFRFCDGVRRRSFLQVGGLTVGGLSLADVLAAESDAVTGDQKKPRHKSVIMVYLSGGMPHQDTFDLKPDAPAEVRGEFKPIETTVPGVQFCELLPKLSMVADKCSIIRSVVGQRDEHSSFQNLTGFTMGEVQRDGIPNFGSVVAKMQGPTDPVIPPFVDLFPTMQHRPYNSTGRATWAARSIRCGPMARTLRACGFASSRISSLRNASHCLDSSTRFVAELMRRALATWTKAIVEPSMC